MARMHSRKKGKSRSYKPLLKESPSWVRYSPKEIETIISKLAKNGNSASEIGMILRDTYGIPDVKLSTKKSITKILEEKKLLEEIPEDLKFLIKKSIAVKKHLEENKQDQTAKRGFQLTESKIRRLVKYYKKSKRLSSDWSYDPEKIKLSIS